MYRIRILVNISIVCFILAIAIYFPNFMSSYLQKSLEGKLSFIDVGVKTYEVKYNNIKEKIVSISKYNDEYGGELKTVPIVIEITEELKENLTKQVLQQLKEIQDGIDYPFPDLNKTDLVSCEKCEIYSSNEANGLSFWKLKYQKKEEKINIIMDTEFNYIYAFKLESMSKNIKKIIQQIKLHIKYQLSYGEILEKWLHNICDYYEIDMNDTSIYPKNIYDKKYKTYYSNKDGDSVFYDYIIYEKTIKDKSSYSNLSSFSSEVDGISDYEYYRIPIKIRYEYEKKEKEIVIDWGLGFFDSMIQF